METGPWGPFHCGSDILRRWEHIDCWDHLLPGIRQPVKEKEEEDCLHTWRQQCKLAAGARGTLSKLERSLGRIGTGTGGPGAPPRQWPVRRNRWRYTSHYTTEADTQAIHVKTPNYKMFLELPDLQFPPPRVWDMWIVPLFQIKWFTLCVQKPLSVAR